MKTNTKLVAAAWLLAATLVNIRDAEACTRILYQGTNGMVITGRSMDWKEDPASNIWIFPRGIERNGEVGKNPMKWSSKYGSVITSAYDICSTDGMNEAGLVANLLWLAESSYPQWDGSKDGLSIAAWVQYMLDNFATVGEAVAFMERGTFEVVSDMMPDGTRMATLHLSISDSEGDSAIFEYIDGELKIHHDKSYVVMTNSPVFDKQLALNDYWKAIGGLTFLPGTNRAADRFVRASFYTGVLPKTDHTRNALAGVFSVMRNTSVPLGISTPGEPNISSTRWRTVSDQKNKVYYFESALYPNVFWVDLKTVDFSENAPVKKLDLVCGKTYAGNVASQFKTTKPFRFIGVDQAN